MKHLKVINAYLICICVMASFGCGSGKGSAQGAHELQQFFEERWNDFKGDKRYSKVTVKEFVFFTKCESVYRGNTSLKDMTTTIFPQGAADWSIDGEDRKDDNVRVVFSRNGEDLSLTLRF